jgi:hypothetical protein
VSKLGLSISDELEIEKIRIRISAIPCCPNDPLADWMEDMGFNPRRGGLLLLPQLWKEEFKPPTPPYVVFSPRAQIPVLRQKGKDDGDEELE